MTEPTRTGWRRLGALMRGLGGTALVAVLCNLGLELSQLTGVDKYPWQYKTPAFPLLFLLGSTVLWLMVGLVQAVVGRLGVTAALFVAATAVVAVADQEKVRLRREPLYPSDWTFARNLGLLVDIVGIRVVVLLAVILSLAVLGALLVARAVRRRLGRRPDDARAGQPRRVRLLARLATATVCLSGLAYVSAFNSPGNAARATYDALGAQWRPWSQSRNYLGNGFVGGFLYNLPAPKLPAPAGYGAAEMRRIAATYQAAARRINRTRDPHGLEDVNVVMILSESFSDPLALRGVHVPTDPIPFTRSLMARTMSGPMLARNIGGGTANMEFEALTGMSMALLPPQMPVPYQTVIPSYSWFPSAARWLARDGHHAVAIHPYTTEMYRRRDVYPRLGFHEFVHDTTMHNRRRIGHHAYISDAAAFDETVRRLRSERAPMFVNLVTMQNHIPYANRYDDPVHVTGPNGDTLRDVGQYVRGITYTDQALRRLIERLGHLHEKTVVVFYGDHLPGSYPSPVYQANGIRRMHQTPFLVWASFPGPATRQPTTSPTHFMDLVLERADAAVPAYYALLQELRHEITAMDGGMMFDRRNRPLTARDLSPRAQRLLHDYRLVQYDLSVGRRLSARGLFAPVGPR